MALLLWAMMMILVPVAVAFLWIFQLYFMERNYIEASITQVQTQLDPVLDQLATEDLADNEDMLRYLSQTADGKMLIVDQQGQLLTMYTYGHPIDLAGNQSDILVWERIVSGPNYEKVLALEPYSQEGMEAGASPSYEYGIPVLYPREMPM